MFLQVFWLVKYLRTWMPLSSAAGLVALESRCCWPKLGRKSWFWNSMTGLEDAATRSVKRATSLMLVRRMVNARMCSCISYLMALFLDGGMLFSVVSFWL